MSSGNSSPADPDPEFIASKLSTPIVFLTQPDAITSTTVHLRWEVRRSHRYVEGFHIKYCAVQSDSDVNHGHDLSPASCAIQTVQNIDVRTHVLKDLEENTQYMIYVQPYYQLKEGAASSTILAHTLEDGKKITMIHFHSAMLCQHVLVTFYCIFSSHQSINQLL